MINNTVSSVFCSLALSSDPAPLVRVWNGTAGQSAALIENGRDRLFGAMIVALVPHRGHCRLRMLGTDPVTLLREPEAKVLIAQLVASSGLIAGVAVGLTGAACGFIKPNLRL